MTMPVIRYDLGWCLDLFVILIPVMRTSAATHSILVVATADDAEYIGSHDAQPKEIPRR